jgi:hypothetical protein
MDTGNNKYSKDSHFNIKHDISNHDQNSSICPPDNFYK